VDGGLDPRDERRRLARASRRDAQHRSGRRGRGAALVWREPGKALDDGLVHTRTMKRGTYRAVNRPLREFATPRPSEPD
jgi:hypothetical protein